MDNLATTFGAEIAASHPARARDVEAYKADALAMQLISERTDKRELVDLVRWLIMDGAALARRGL